MRSTRPICLIAILLASLAAGLGLATGALAALSAQETPLNPGGAAFEINLDSQGSLWISDSHAGEVRRVNPLDGSYTVYPVGGSPSDARSDGAGMLWWADPVGFFVGRLNTGTGEVSQWSIGGARGPYGTALDGSGGLWISDYFLSSLHHLLPSASELCTYTLPTDASSYYLLASGSHVWLGDVGNGKIGRLDTTNNTFTWWALTPGSRPIGLALDSLGNLWWADQAQGRLGLLVPGSGQVITYTQTTLQTPTTVALSAGKVWYTDGIRVGVLNPVLAARHASTVTPSSQVSPPLCKTITSPSTRTVVPSGGQANWSNVTYSELISSIGWHVFELPPGGSTWGVASVGNNIWLVDQGRKVLAKTSDLVEKLVYLPMIRR